MDIAAMPYQWGSEYFRSSEAQKLFMCLNLIPKSF